VTRFSHTSIMHKVLVQVGLQQFPVIVLVDELENRNSVLLGEWLKDVGEMGSFGLWRNTLTSRSVSRKTGLDVEGWFCHPVGVVFFDSGPHSSLEPLDMLRLLFTRHLVVDLQGQIGNERRLRSSKVLWNGDVKSER